MEDKARVESTTERCFLYPTLYLVGLVGLRRGTYPRRNGALPTSKPAPTFSVVAFVSQEILKVCRKEEKARIVRIVEVSVAGSAKCYRVMWVSFI